MEKLNEIEKQIDALEALEPNYGHKTLSNVLASLKAIRKYYEQK